VPDGCRPPPTVFLRPATAPRDHRLARETHRSIRRLLRGSGSRSTRRAGRVALRVKPSDVEIMRALAADHRISYSSTTYRPRSSRQRERLYTTILGLRRRAISTVYVPTTLTRCSPCDMHSVARRRARSRPTSVDPGPKESLVTSLLGKGKEKEGEGSSGPRAAAPYIGKRCAEKEALPGRGTYIPASRGISVHASSRRISRPRQGSSARFAPHCLLAARRRGRRRGRRLFVMVRDGGAAHGFGGARSGDRPGAGRS